MDQEKAGATYLEGCDDINVKNKRAERSVEEIEENDDEEEDLAGSCPSEDGGSISGADEQEEVSDGQSQEEMDGGPGEEVSDDAAHDRWGEDSAHKGEETKGGGESERSCTASEDESSGKNEETTEEASARRRVIRLYQYDDSGQRYGHLPDSTCDDAGPAPRPKQRSLSLTRLNAIMAAASVGPLHHSEDTPRLQMDIWRRELSCSWNTPRNGITFALYVINTLCTHCATQTNVPCLKLNEIWNISNKKGWHLFLKVKVKCFIWKQKPAGISVQSYFRTNGPAHKSAGISNDLIWGGGAASFLQ